MAIFSKIDSNGDGFLDQDEIKRALDVNGVKPDVSNIDYFG